MVVLDELRFPNAPTLYDVVGGSGAYTVLGARLIAGPERSNDVGCFILAGDDFPESVLETLGSWGVRLNLHRVAGHKSTRGLLEYQDEVFGRKTFRYTTETLQPLPEHLPRELLGSSAFHFLAPPELLKKQVVSLLKLRQENGFEGRPLIVWEPAPPFCKPDMRDAHLEACKLVDVFSPNHLELGRLFRDSNSTSSLGDGDKLDRHSIEIDAQAFIDSGIGPSSNGSIVVRAGEHGCMVASESLEAPYIWVPPFYDTAERIIDATGAGNTFLGGFTMAMTLERNLVEGIKQASVVTSLALEQIGLPRLGKDKDENETWNESYISERMDRYKGKTKPLYVTTK